jgi:AraC-like DNA-binding protein
MTDVAVPLLLDAALRGIVVALLLLLAAVFARDRPRLAQSRVGTLLALGLVIQVIASTPTFETTAPRLWQAPGVGISVGNAVLFCLFVLALFDDDFVLRPWHGAAWLAVFAVSAFNCATAWRDPSVFGRIAVGLQRSVPLVAAVLAATAAASTWRADLVEKRRRLRLFIVVAGSLYTVAMFAVRIASPQGRLSPTSATLDAGVLLAMVAVVAYGMLRLAPSELFPRGVVAPALDAGRALAPETPVGAPDSADGASSPAPPDPAEERLAAALRRLMREEHAYRTEGLTIASLAARLGVPEYRLRRHVNQRLGFRNFNAYVNGFRLEEARTQLADPARRELPVLTIALEAGFQSIGPFNRAFKAATGLTPTEFRRENSADS